MARNFKVDLINVNYGAVRLSINGERLLLSRGQIGLLFLFQFVSEVTRPEVREYFMKIGVSRAFETNRKNVHHATISRMVRLLKNHELLVQYNQRLYRTMKGQAVVMAVMQFLLERARELMNTEGVKLADIEPWQDLFATQP